MNPEPESIARLDDGRIEIRFADQTVRVWTPRQLRERCPCAACREKRRGQGDASRESKADAMTGQASRPKPVALPILSAAEAAPLTVTSMQPVGRYAYQIGFSDGHRSGLYTLDRLHAGPGT